MTTRIGIVVVAHAPLASALLSAVRGILPDLQQVAAVDIDSDAPAIENSAQITRAMAIVDSSAGILIATDLFGATPANLSLSLIAPPHSTLIAGVNLPLLLKLCSQWQTRPMVEVLAAVHCYVAQTIKIGSAA